MKYIYTFILVQTLVMVSFESVLEVLNGTIFYKAIDDVFIEQNFS